MGPEQGMKGLVVLRLGLVMVALSYLYTVYTRNRAEHSISVEQAILDGWNKIIAPPSIQFRKIVVGINCNVDLVVSGTALLRKLMQKSTPGTTPKDAIGELAPTTLSSFRWT